MIENWTLAVLVSGIVGTVLGWWVVNFRFKRQGRLRLKHTVMEYVTGASTDLQLVDEAALTRRQDQLLYDLYLQCHRGEAPRAYTLIENLSDGQRTTDMDRLLLRIGLQTNRYEHLTRTLARMKSSGGVERQVFGSLVCAGRWSEAVHHYESTILRKKGSRSEWRMLCLCASVFGDGIDVQVEFDPRETYFLNALETRGKNDGTLMAEVRAALESGACYTAELMFAFKNKEFETKNESSEQTLHHTSVREGRGDWLFVEFERFRQQLEAANMESLLECEHGLRVREWLRLHRAYECSYCGQFRRGFSLICGGCLCFDPGQPVQLSLQRSGEVAMPILDIDLFETECLYWMSLLQAT